MNWYDLTALNAGAWLALTAVALSVADRCRPAWQPLAALVACAAGGLGTMYAARLIGAWVMIRAEGLT